MTLRQLRLGIAAVLFAAWIGWLIYLAYETKQPIVLSRPQFLVSNLDVLAEIDRLDAAKSQVQILEVFWPKTEAEKKKWLNKTIAIGNLAECKGWTGKGAYILPLMTDGKEYFRVAPIPPSPGYPDQSSKLLGPQIYADTPETRRQLGEIPKPAGVP